jgi:tryptophanyl-tRNA synthetase
LRPLQERYRELTADPVHLDRIMEEGAAKARPMARETLHLVKERVGLL